MALTIVGKLAEQERLDAEDPLRHLRGQDGGSDGDDDDGDGSDSGETSKSILPPQPASIQDTLIRISVPLPKPHPPIDLSLAIDAGPGCGGITWPAGEVLARYLARRGPHALRGRRVLELGSGTGLVGILAGTLGANVWITDQAVLVPTMHRNATLNAILAPSVQSIELNWGEAIPSGLPDEWDIVLAADCVYFEPSFPLLVKTLCDLIPHGCETEVLFCYKKRRKADKRFFMMLKKHFEWADVEDDPDREIYSREAIALLRLRRRKPST